ncbi:hypothetical protein OPV22_015207 [Ensete ventricosum]|uniref:Plus3 domain-containing protein n=1 Tax=Ensete ventricosum TaxID=4639 RepID=A0AAV8RDL9_ENSVE|nr:hypothetical protein OPV22_015207 [Ensete ventricosum]
MKKNKLNKEEIAEDYCFTCKDGGHLRVCDFRNCLKAYHPQCVGKDPSFMESDERWTCGWHSCFICQKASALQCYCCPNSVCHSCIKEAEFVQVKKRTKGFCNNCLKLAILIEENIDVDSDGGKVDFRDTETYEFLFKDYWEIIKDQEGLTLIDLQAANALLKRGENYKGGSDSDKLAEEDVESEGDDLEINSDDGLSFLEDLKGKCGRMKKPIKRSRSKKKVFISWGSVELINFLISVGRDTKEPLTLLDACEIIKDYIHRNNLRDPDTRKKKNVICDERLYALFRKKKVKFHKIESLLESHFATNDDSDEEISFSSEDGDTFGRRKKQNTGYDDMPHKVQPKEYKEDISAATKSCYASIVRKNINSVYLKRSLIMEFLKSPDTFEEKVTGCFVRLKVDPEDFYFVPEKRYKLGQVTGVKKALQTYKVGTMSTDVVLRVSNYHADVQLFILSDDDFDEDECEDLLQLANKGLFKRPTVAELEKKIRSVHADIMNHWIDKEILKEKLRTSEERKRLLQEIPIVVTDISRTEAKNTNGPPISSENATVVTVKVAEVIAGNEVAFQKYTNEGALAGLSTNVEDPPQDYKDGDAADMDSPVKNTEECQLPKAADANNSGSGRVIEIEEDHGVTDSKITGNMRISDHVDEDKTWHYVDPSGNEQGPFDMVSLRLIRKAPVRRGRPSDSRVFSPA